MRMAEVLNNLLYLLEIDHRLLPRGLQEVAASFEVQNQVNLIFCGYGSL